MTVAIPFGPRREKPRQWGARVEGREASLRVQPASACRSHGSENRSELLSSFHTSILYSTVQNNAQSVDVFFWPDLMAVNGWLCVFKLFLQNCAHASSHIARGLSRIEAEPIHYMLRGAQDKEACYVDAVAGKRTTLHSD